ncbi:hypothetical protein Y1Q_0017357 [Alligator mississippiensis]|uniref:Uncharacterized protein n=1 Tax=Alligator mississippiensis TaxID=8496 RepID=A0A151NGE4_ALLMI|nr:hypothetical protein Y1Q_0017357 [Alligator mississippiensis]
MGSRCGWKEGWVCTCGRGEPCCPHSQVYAGEEAAFAVHATAASKYKLHSCIKTPVLAPLQTENTGTTRRAV